MCKGKCLRGCSYNALSFKFLPHNSDSTRYKYKHSILRQGEVGGSPYGGGQRLSLMIRVCFTYVFVPNSMITQIPRIVIPTTPCYSYAYANLLFATNDDPLVAEANAD
jgi:hypothetical protein